MKIAIVTDESRTKYLKDFEGEFEDAQKARTVKTLKETISKKYECVDLIFDENLIEKLKSEKIDLVFNLCNGIVGSSRLSQLPALLEHEQIPYTGSKPLGHALAYNKIYSGKIFEADNISTPDFSYVEILEDLDYVDMEFPLFVKPVDEGSSRGIYQDNIVNNPEELYNKVRSLIKQYNPPVMIMEYIQGTEFTVGIIENGEKVLPIVEIDFSNLPAGIKRINSFEVKNEYQDSVKYYIPARLEENLKDKVEDIAKKVFRSLDLKDYCRMDIILRDDIFYVIEVNSLPGLERGYSDICKMAKVDGIGYDGLIYSIIDSAKKRYNI